MSYPTIKLGDVFTEGQVIKLMDLACEAEFDLENMIGRLKAWFSEPEMALQLNAKGLLPEFAAYAIGYAICTKFKEKEKQQQPTKKKG